MTGYSIKSFLLSVHVLISLLCLRRSTNFISLTVNVTFLFPQTIKDEQFVFFRDDINSEIRISFSDFEQQIS